MTTPAKNEDRIAIPGSYRPLVPKSKLIKPADPEQRIKVSLYARRNPKPDGELVAAAERISSVIPARRHYLTDDEFKNVYGADPADLKRITDWATAEHLDVEATSVEKRRVIVEGTIRDVSNAFGVELNEYSHSRLGSFRAREGSIHIAADVYGVIEGVFGLDTRPTCRPRLRKSRFAPIPWEEFAVKKTKTKRAAKASATPTTKWPGTFFPPQVAKLYNYPAQFDGTGQNIAIFNFNGPPSPDPHGGYKLTALQTYFEKTLGGVTPTITDVVVMGAGNNPGPDTPASSRRGDSTGEVMLDACVVGSVAPGAKIFMYFTEFSSRGWVDALHDAIAGANGISVISISYGNPENDPQSLWSQMGVTAVNQAFQSAQAKGITICCAAGDDGSTDGGTVGSEVDFPAASPFVLSVGGTKLVANAAQSAITSEVVWNEITQQEGAGGGGISAIFTKPSYQAAVNVPPAVDPPHKIGRGVPDVSAVADPVTGVVIMRVDNTLEPIGGTSASAPLWSALIARLNQGLKARCGFINPILYTKAAKGVLRDITKGDNGAYSARAGWDACTGLGSPDGGNLLKALSK